MKAEHSTLRIITPFIKAGTIRRLLMNRKPNSIEVLTRFNLRDFYAGVSDVAALRFLLEKGAQIKGIKDLHSKVYLFGHRRAIVTSANLTQAALQRNHEFGFVTGEPSIIERCHAYFQSLWQLAGSMVLPVQLTAWERELESAYLKGSVPASPPNLGDAGTDIGSCESNPILIAPPASPSSPSSAEPGTSAFVKFFGESSNRVEPRRQVLEELRSSGSHWACPYPRGKRPRNVRDGDVMFLARMTKNPDDYMIYGRAIAMEHRPGRDDATEADIALRDWKQTWPHYIRVHSGVFIAGTLANGVSLNALMDTLRSEAFRSTESNARAMAGNTNPRRSIMQKAAVVLTTKAFDWLEQEFARALDRHSQVARADLQQLDKPT